jgi:hypothetical protein
MRTLSWCDFGYSFRCRGSLGSAFTGIFSQLAAGSSWSGVPGLGDVHRDTVMDSASVAAPFAPFTDAGSASIAA